MPELRIILLVLGVLFVAGIAGFEWWRSRGQRPAAAVVSRGSRAESPEPEAAARRSTERAEVKPLPEINVVREPRMPVADTLPVIELASTTETGTRRALGISIANEVAVDMPQESDAGSPEIGRAEPYIGQAPVGQVPVGDGIDERIRPGADISDARVVVPAAVPTLGVPKLTLVWPPEGERRIVTLRVIPKSDPRFPGRLLRQAFAGCGFWHGPMDIFHLPDEQGRVLLSAAALAQPGTFDPSIMDSQRFSGLNLFAVLPGPRPEREVFEELVHAARQLAERLGGQITDQHGEELTAERISRLRQSLETSAPAADTGQA